MVAERGSDGPFCRPPDRSSSPPERSHDRCGKRRKAIAEAASLVALTARFLQGRTPACWPLQANAAVAQ
jgi:hypothetical protein